MPKYQYACPTCEVEFEIKRSFAECDQPAHCPDCGGVAARRPTLFGYVKGGSSAPKPAAQQKKVHAVGCPCCSAAPRPKAPTSAAA